MSKKKYMNELEKQLDKESKSLTIKLIETMGLTPHTTTGFILIPFKEVHFLLIEKFKDYYCRGRKQGRLDEREGK